MRISKASLRVGIDARMINASGIGRYVRNLIEELQKIDKENEYYVFLLKKDLPQINLPKNFHKVEADFLWYTLKEQTRFPAILNKHKLDLVHFPHFNIPVLYKGKFVVTIHDLTHLDFKMKRASTHNRVFYEVKHQAHIQVLKTALKRSKKILTPSNFVKEEIVTRFNIKPEKIEVTYEAVDEKIIELSEKITKDNKRKALEKFGIKPPFIFYVGNAHPHKNVESLISVFREIRGKYQYLKLVLSCRQYFFWKRIAEGLSQKDIIYTGFLTDEELVVLYKNAQVFVFPSFSEGFGIPMLEAMACGCPVVSSDKTSLPEIGADAAVYFDPNNLSDMSEKITKALNDQKLRKDLIAKGEKRFKEYSWKKMAEQTQEIYLKSIL
jgi:glycosyltransferase involved in cell wall biosynthesis